MKGLERVNAASILVSEDCNLACKYCFEEPRKFRQKMSWEVGKRTIDVLSQHDNYHLMMFGGEPFLNFKLMKQMTDYALSLKVPFSVNIITNATIMTQEIKDWLSNTDFNLSVQLSVDGPKHIHDAYRVDKRGHGSFDRIEKNLPDFVEALETNPNGHLNVHGCLNADTIGKAYEIYSFFKHEWKTPWIWLMPIHGETWEHKHVGVYHEELKKIAAEIIDDVKRTGDISLLKHYAPIDKIMNFPKGHSKPCGAGDSFVTITANGEIWPCHEFYYNDPEQIMSFGDIFNGVNSERMRVFQEYEHSDLGCDTDCNVYNCYRCIADNYRKNGSMFATIRGARCLMSIAEREVIMDVNKQMEELGFFEKG